MKNIIIFLSLIFILSGCATLEQKPIIETRITKIKIPSEFLVIPPYGKKIDIDSATQKDVSQWILDTEERMYILERNISKIKQFNEESVTEKDIK